jgi:NAD(P)-dependent dehydrogenase (short-subunit alcohol dehydrogenase family)
MSRFTDTVAVVTGAGSGIGRELARALAKRGARLAISDVNETALAETAALCMPAQVRTYRLDVSSREQVFAHAAAVQRDFGAVHFLFNNAGVSIAATFEHITIEELEWLLGINLWGVIYGSKAFLPIMLEQREGHIVNLSSIFGFVGIPTQSAYNIAKFGVRGLTECLWRELEGTGVQATSVHPGGIKTNIDRAAPMGKFAGDTERKMMETIGKMLVTPAEVCAREILDGVERGAKRIVTGKSARLVDFVARLLPEGYGRVLAARGV